MTEFNWVKANRCQMGACVVVDRRAEVVHLADSKQEATPDRPVISVDPSTFDGFLAALQHSQSEGSSNGVAWRWTGARSLILTHGGKSLAFSGDEWTAFLQGVADGDFRAERFQMSTV